jgi:hypothetical protein
MPPIVGGGRWPAARRTAHSPMMWRATAATKRGRPGRPAARGRERSCRPRHQLRRFGRDREHDQLAPSAAVPCVRSLTGCTRGTPSRSTAAASTESRAARAIGRAAPARRTDGRATPNAPPSHNASSTATTTLDPTPHSRAGPQPVASPPVSLTSRHRTASSRRLPRSWRPLVLLRHRWIAWATLSTTGRGAR